MAGKLRSSDTRTVCSRLESSASMAVPSFGSRTVRATRRILNGLLQAGFSTCGATTRKPPTRRGRAAPREATASAFSREEEDATSQRGVAATTRLRSRPTARRRISRRRAALRQKAPPTARRRRHALPKSTFRAAESRAFSWIRRTATIPALRSLRFRRMERRLCGGISKTSSTSGASSARASGSSTAGSGAPFRRAG